MCLQLCKVVRCCKCCSGSTYIFFPVYVALLIGILIANINKIGPLNKLDKSLIKYAVDNECSDEVLMTALTGLQENLDISKSIKIHIALVILSAISLAFHAGFLLLRNS